MIRSTWIAASAIALLVALGGEAIASECHKNCNGGYLGMTALLAGSLALGSAAIGTRIGGSSALKRVDRADMDTGTTSPAARVEDVAPSTRVPPVPPEDRGTTAAAAAATDSVTSAPAEAPVLRDAHDRTTARGAMIEPSGGTAPDAAASVVKHGTDYAGKLAKEMAPHGGAIDSSLGVAQKVIANEDRVAGLAEGLTDAATEEIKDVVKDATKVTSPAAPAPGASVGTTLRYCPSCGTKTREGARFCAQCGHRLA